MDIITAKELSKLLSDYERVTKQLEEIELVNKSTSLEICITSNPRGSESSRKSVMVTSNTKGITNFAMNTLAIRQKELEVSIGKY